MNARLKTGWTLVRARARDIGVRAFHTWWQAFGASLAVAWAASGLDISQITSIDSLKRFLVALAAAVVAAALSAAKSTWLAIRTHPAAHETAASSTVPTQGA